MDEEKDFEEADDSTTETNPDILAAWEFPEHDTFERGRRWYIVASLVVLGLLVYSYFDNNPLFAIIIILTIVVFAITEYRGPESHTIALTPDGIIAGPEFFPYNDVKNFFIIYEPPKVKMLYFDPKRISRPLIGVPLDTQDPNEIRSILLNYLPEDLAREDEPHSDYLGRLLKF